MHDSAPMNSEAEGRESDPSLAELDRILAELAEGDRQHKTATTSAVSSTPTSLAHQALHALTKQSSPVVPSTPTPGAQQAVLSTKRSRSSQAAVDAIAPSLEKPWRLRWPLEKLASSFNLAELHCGFAFTLGLSLSHQTTLEGHTDPARLMSHYLNREFKRHHGKRPPYSFIFEVSAAGRLHLHGVVIPEIPVDHARRSIKNALSAAGGQLDNALIVRASQSHLTALYDGLGWFAYVSKSHEDTECYLGTPKISFISTSLKRLCKEAGKTSRGRAQRSADVSSVAVRSYFWTPEHKRNGRSPMRTGFVSYPHSMLT